MQKIRIKLKAFDCRLLESSVQDIIEQVKNTGTSIRGPIPLPIKIEKFCVNRSPHIDKKSREQFEIRTHKRMLDIIDPNDKTIEALTNLELPAGVEVDIKQ